MGTARRLWGAWRSMVTLRRDRVVLAGILLIGAGLRLFHLGYRSLTTDEANVFWMARGSADEIVRHNAAGNSAPPLYAVALSAADAHASEAALRSLSCVAGIGAIYALAYAYAGAAGALPMRCAQPNGWRPASARRSTSPHRARRETAGARSSAAIARPKGASPSRRDQILAPPSVGLA